MSLDTSGIFCFSVGHGTSFLGQGVADLTIRIFSHATGRGQRIHLVFDGRSCLEYGIDNSRLSSKTVPNGVLYTPDCAKSSSRLRNVQRDVRSSGCRTFLSSSTSPSTYFKHIFRSCCTVRQSHAGVFFGRYSTPSRTAVYLSHASFSLSCWSSPDSISVYFTRQQDALENSFGGVCMSSSRRFVL